MLEKIIGQKDAKETVEILIQSTKKQGGPFPHSLFTGPPGIGKTSFAREISKELGYRFLEINSSCTGSAAEVRIKLFASLEMMKENDVLFLDEIHSINKKIQEILYTAVEDGYVSWGEQFGDKLKLKPFTLLGATTDLAGLTQAMQSRFKYQIKLSEYTDDEIAQIISSTQNNTSFNPMHLAPFCRGNPRTALNYLDWIERYSATMGTPPTQQIIKQAMDKRHVYKYGLTKDDLRYIELLKLNKIMGVRSIANTLNIPEKTVKEKIEPYLLKLNIIKIATNLGNKRTINTKRVMELDLWR